MLRVANSQASQPFPQSPFSMVLWCWPSCCNGKQGFSTFNTTSHPADPGSRVRPNALGNPGIFQHTGHKASHLASHVFFCITPGKGLPHCGQFSQHCLMIIIGSLGSLFELCTFLSILLRAAQLLRITCYGNTTESQGALIILMIHICWKGNGTTNCPIQPKKDIHTYPCLIFLKFFGQCSFNL